MIKIVQNSGRKKYQSWSLIIILLIAFLTNLSAQRAVWEAGYNGFFDNREYFNDYVEPQTMFGSRVFGYGGFSINETQAFFAGLDILYEFGDKIQEEDLSPILFFEFQKDFIDLRMGAFPRKNLVKMPLFMQNDTLFYYRPNIQGIYLNLKQSWGSHNLWVDWTSRQTDTNRETFQIGGSGDLKHGIFFYKQDFIMTHFAGPAIPIQGDHIRDNGGFSARIGLNLSKLLFDSLYVSTGYCFSYDRVRHVKLEYAHGNLTQLYLQLYGFGIRATNYYGNGQIQMGGDGLYAAPSYQRFDFSWSIFRSDNVKGKIEFSFHLIEDELDYSQSFTIYATIGNKQRTGIKD